MKQKRMRLVSSFPLTHGKCKCAYTETVLKNTVGGNNKLNGGNCVLGMDFSKAQNVVSILSIKMTLNEKRLNQPEIDILHGGRKKPLKYHRRGLQSH